MAEPGVAEPGIEIDPANSAPVENARGEAPAPDTGNIPPEQKAELDKLAAKLFGEAPPKSEVGSQKSEVVAELPKKSEPPAKVDEVVPEAVLNPPEPEKPKEIEVPPEIKSEAGKQNFRTLAKNYDEAKRTIASLEAKLKDQPTEAGAHARIRELETRLAEVMPAFERINLEAHPDFQRQFVRPVEQAMQHGNSLLKEAGMEEGLFERVMALGGKSRTEAMDELVAGINSPSMKGQIIQLASQVAQLQEQKAAALRDVKGNAQRLEEHRRSEDFRLQQENERQLGSLFDNVLEHLREKGGFEMLRESSAAGTEKWNEQVKATVQTARDLILNNTDMTQAVAAAILAAQTPHYRRAYLSERTRRLEAEKQVAEMRGAEPGLERGGKDVALPEELDFTKDIGKAGLAILNRA